MPKVSYYYCCYIMRPGLYSKQDSKIDAALNHYKCPILVCKNYCSLKFLLKVNRVLNNNVSDLYAIPWGWSGLWLQPWWWRGQQDWRRRGGRGKEENKGTYIPHLEDCYTIIVSGLLMRCVPRALNNWRHNLQFQAVRVLTQVYCLESATSAPWYMVHGRLPCMGTAEDLIC